MFTEKAINHAEACRYCWMCRHCCPVGLVTGKEGNNARAKGLLVSMDGRNIPLDADAMKLMYECCLCKACTNDCATAYDPSIFILEARTKAVVDGLVPANVQTVIDRVLAGNLSESAVDADLAKKIAALPNKADTVLYLGELARKDASAMANAVIDLLTKAKVEFAVLDEEPATGAQLGELIGYTAEVKAAAEACMNALAGAKTIVVLDPTDAAFIKHQWTEWDVLKADVVTATEYVAALVKDGKLAPKKLGLKAAYHDPERLARDLDETEAAREIMAAMGVEVAELFLNKKLTKSCGSAVMAQTHPAIVAEMAAARWSDVAFLDGTSLITSCPVSYSIMSADVPAGMEIEDLFVLLNSAC